MPDIISTIILICPPPGATGAISPRRWDPFGKSMHAAAQGNAGVKVIDQDRDDVALALRWVSRQAVRPVAVFTVAATVVMLTVGVAGLALGAVAGGVALTLGGLGVAVGGNQLARSLARWAD
jgi:hypothetical protein